MTSSTIVAVVVTSTHHRALAARVRECGDTYRFETHLETPDGVSVRVACLCPDGHGVAHLPWRGWFTKAQGRYDLADIPAPTRTAFVCTEAPEPVDLDALVAAEQAEYDALLGTAEVPCAA